MKFLKFTISKNQKKENTVVWHTSKNDAAHAKQALVPEIFPPRLEVTAQLLPQKKLWISYEKFQMLKKKNSTTAVFSPRSATRYVTF